MARLLSNGELPEDVIHKTVIQWVRTHPFFKGKSGLVIHIPNESPRTSRYGRKMKDMGMRAGVADLLIAMPCKGFCGAWIELKSKNGKLSKTQKEFLEDMRQQNYFTAVCSSIDEAIKTIEGYCFN